METAELLTHLEGNIVIVNGQFRLVRRLGGAGTSAVFLAEVEAAGREADGGAPENVALKLLAADSPHAEARLAGWNQAAKLSHPNLIRVFETGHCELDDRRFVYQATEYADEVLADILLVRPLTQDETLAMLMPIFDVLEFLKGKGYAHGRLRPSNVLVVNDTLKLSADCVALDPGARIGRGDVRDVLDVYDAPELDLGVVTPAIDAWSLGMTLMAALTQRPANWVRQNGQDQAIPDLVVPSGIPEPFAGIARSCLVVNPAERSALKQIKAILESESVAQESTVVAEPEPEIPESKSAALDPGHEPEAAVLSPGAALDQESPTEIPAVEIPATTIAAIEPPGRQNRATSWKPSLIVLAVVVIVVFAALLVRNTQFSHRDEASPNPPVGSAPQSQASQPTPPQTSPDSTQQPLNSPPLPAAPNVKPGTGTIASSPDGDGGNSAEGEGVVNRVIPTMLDAAQRSIRGRVRVGVRVMVDAAGNVTYAAVQDPSKSSYFNRIALDAAQQWKFASGSVGGTWNVQFEFRQDGIDAQATPE
jgi:TonB family protein